MDWQEFAKEITAAFSPITEEDQARKQLKGLTQTGNIQNYVQRFRDLILRIPSMSQADVFAAFMDGLKPAIRQQIAPHVTTLAEAQIMAAKVDLDSDQGSRPNPRTSGGTGGNNKKMGGGKGKGKGHLGVVEEGTSSKESVYVLVEKKKLTNLQKKNKAAVKKLQQQKKKNQGK